MLKSILLLALLLVSNVLKAETIETCVHEKKPTPSLAERIPGYDWWNGIRRETVSCERRILGLIYGGHTEQAQELVETLKKRKIDIHADQLIGANYFDYGSNNLSKLLPLLDSEKVKEPLNTRFNLMISWAIQDVVTSNFSRLKEDVFSFLATVRDNAGINTLKVDVQQTDVIKSKQVETIQCSLDRVNQRDSEGFYKCWKSFDLYYGLTKNKNLQHLITDGLNNNPDLLENNLKVIIKENGFLPDYILDDANIQTLVNRFPWLWKVQVKSNFSYGEVEDQCAQALHFDYYDQTLSLWQYLILKNQTYMFEDVTSKEKLLQRLNGYLNEEGADFTQVIKSCFGKNSDLGNKLKRFFVFPKSQNRSPKYNTQTKPQYNLFVVDGITYQFEKREFSDYQLSAYEKIRGLKQKNKAQILRIVMDEWIHQSAEQKNVNVESARNKVSEFQSEVTASIHQTNTFKTQFETALVHMASSEISYNVDYNNILDPLFDGRMQCLSGTLLTLQVAMKNNPDLNNVAVALQYGHVLPVVVLDAEERGHNLLFLETTVASIKKNQTQLRQRVGLDTFLVDAGHYLLLNFFGSAMIRREVTRNEILEKTSDTWQIPFSLANYLSWQANSSSGYVGTKQRTTTKPVDFFSFGQVAVSPGDQSRQLIQEESSYVEGASAEEPSYAFDVRGQQRALHGKDSSDGIRAIYQRLVPTPAPFGHTESVR